MVWGEPLVGKKPLLELSDQFIERCDRANVEYAAGIITNGYLLDPETCAELRDRRVSNAQVGLDGPPDIHDRMRPLAGGKPSFRHIIKNLHHAVDYMGITIRVNLDVANFGRAEELLKILAAEGFSQKLSVYSAQLVAVADGGAPSATYGSCFSNRNFARAEMEFDAMAHAYGFTAPSLPRPTGAPCTAVRKNAPVVGSQGELYKCWEPVGNPNETIGNIRDLNDINGRLHKWLGYNPFANSECRGCIALPVCMGGCARHAIDVQQYENRCGTFRHTYRERVLNFIEASEQSGFTSIAPAPALANRMKPASALHRGQNVKLVCVKIPRMLDKSPRGPVFDLERREARDVVPHSTVDEWNTGTTPGNSVGPRHVHVVEPVVRLAPCTPAAGMRSAHRTPGCSIAPPAVRCGSRWRTRR